MRAIYRGLSVAAAIVSIVCGLAFVGLRATAQVMPNPMVQNVGPADIFQDVTQGLHQAASFYATAQQINGVIGYQDLGIATTGNTYTYLGAQMNMIMRPAGTLAAVTLTTTLYPGDGQVECFFSTQTTTALTWTANTNQTMGSDAPSAGVANTRQCMQYEVASTTWHRIQ